jgi:hypothetical protein
MQQLITDLLAYTRVEGKAGGLLPRYITGRGRTFALRMQNCTFAWARRGVVLFSPFIPDNTSIWARIGISLKWYLTLLQRTAD